MMTTPERFRAARFFNGLCERFMALERRWDDGRGFVPVGGTHPSTFKTLRNARKAAGPDGFVVVFDPRMLPLVATEATHDQVDGGNVLDDEAFAERQLLYWESELAAIRVRRNQ